MLVKAKVAHTQPISHSYREEGEEFEHDGELYGHVVALEEVEADAPAKGKKKSSAKGKPDSDEE